MNKMLCTAVTFGFKMCGTKKCGPENCFLKRGDIKYEEEFGVIAGKKCSNKNLNKPEGAADGVYLKGKI